MNQVPTLSRYAHALGARILLDVGDGSSLPTCGHLGAYAGLALICLARRRVDVLHAMLRTGPAYHYTPVEIPACTA